MLVAVSGTLAGESWPLGESSLTLGRAASCDVRLDDALASRHHCTLAVQEGLVHLEGARARNPVLVNGLPVRAERLGVGDRFSVGSEQFLIARRTSRRAAERSPQSSGETVSLGELLSPRDSKTPVNLAPGVRVSTTEQLVVLFETISRLAECASREEAMAQFSAQLTKRFVPDAMWLARTQGPGNRFNFRPMPGFEEVNAAPPSSKIVKLVLRENSGTCTGRLASDDGRETMVSSIISPLAIGKASHGAIILHRSGGRVAYTDSDSVFLESLARACAPVLHAVGVIGELRRDNARLRKRAGESTRIIGDSPAIHRLKRALEQASGSSLNVLIQGETGTGKELAARVLHESSPRAGQPFVIVNCAAIPEELFESQVFGYRKGAFTGAFETFEGLLAQADGGTLFLDEIADLSLPNQARILRAAETGTYRPVGAALELAANVRIVSATNKDLLALIQEGSFREDLYHRLCGFEILCPPLRDHPEDIPALAQHFLDEAREHAPMQLDLIAPEAIDALLTWPWRGNVRELRACIFRAAATALEPTLRKDDFHGNQLSARGATPGQLDLRSWERHHILQVLERCGGNVNDAAALLGIGRSTLYKKMAHFGIPH